MSLKSFRVLYAVCFVTKKVYAPKDVRRFEGSPPKRTRMKVARTDTDGLH